MYKNYLGYNFKQIDKRPKVKFFNKKLIIFDFDGTLIDSVGDLAAAINKMLLELKQEPINEETIRQWVGNGAQALVKRALCNSYDFNQSSIDHTLFEEALEHFLLHYKEAIAVKTCCYKGVKETLTALQQRGYILAIVTNKPYRFIEPILTALQLQEYFSLLVGADSLPYKKPHPEPLRYTAQELKCTIEDSIMIGDSKNDILAAKAANMDSIAVTYGYNYTEDIRDYKPDALIDRFDKLLEVLA
jgi:phosphoglycolate phosphatase